MSWTRRRLERVAVCVGLLAAPAAALGAGGVVFRVLPGEQTGLKKIIEGWAAEELKRQGGKYGSHGWWLWGLTAVDLDNDGDPDLIPTHHGLSGGLVLKNTFKETGSVAFTDVTAEFGVDSRKLPGAIGRRTFGMDLNGDGWLDLVGIRSPHYLNEAGRKLTPRGRKGFNTVHPVGVEDVNGDGYPDILEALSALVLDPKTTAFRRADRIPPCQAKVPKAVMDEVALKRRTVRFWRYRYFTGQDLNGDGIDDVVISGFAGYSGHPLGRYLTADETGTLTDKTAAMGLPAEAAPIALVDLNGDGAVDVLSAAGKLAGVYLNDGKGAFAVAPGPPTTFLRRRGPYLHRAWRVDFDCDGDPDLVLSNPRYRAEEIYENLGGGKFKLLHKASGWDSDPVAVCDVNDDGLCDLAIGGPKNSITIYLNASPRPGNRCNVHVRMDKPNPYAAGALVEVFRAGRMGDKGARPWLSEKAHADGTPVRVGLGKAGKFDLRVTFPGGKRVEAKAVEAAGRIKVTPGGRVEQMEPAARRPAH